MSDTAATPDPSPELAAARRAREAQAELCAAGRRDPLLPPPAPDPLPLCVYTTVALLAWALTPAVIAAFFGLLGLWAYGRAWRAGLRKSDCILRDPRLVMLYLGLAAAGGLGWTVLQLVRLARG